MGKEWLNISMSDEQLNEYIIKLINEHREKNIPYPEDSYVLMEINDRIVGMAPSSEKAVNTNSAKGKVVVDETPKNLEIEATALAM